jgi:ABC-type branched-subunit amino acid transport system substrate-binding protein
MAMFVPVPDARRAPRALHRLLAALAIVATAACATTVPGEGDGVQGAGGSRPNAARAIPPSPRPAVPPAPPVGNPTPSPMPAPAQVQPQITSAALGPPAASTNQVVTPGQVATPPATTEGAPADFAAAPAVQAKIAALLPLSGANAEIGTALLDAMNLALADARGGIPVDFLPRDTGGTPEGARAAAQSAIEAGATLLVGPLFGAEIPAVADLARAARVPVLGLTNNAAAASPGVFVLGMLPKTQVERSVGFARGKGARRFALVAPNDDYGRLVEDAYRRAVTAGGGQIAVVERHGGDVPGISAAVKRIAAAIERIDALLIAGNGDTLLLAASFVPYFDIDAREKHIMVATVAWDDPRLAREVALFGAHMAAPLTKRREDFARRYRESFGRDAPLLASLGYDAAALAIAALREAGDGALGPVLANPGGFEGYEGIFRLLPDGTNVRQLPILQFQRGGPRIVDEAAE